MPASSSHNEIANAPQIQSPTTASIASSNLQSTSPTIPQQNTNATNQNTLDASTPPPTTSLDASTDALSADSGGTGGTSIDKNNSTVATPVPSSKPTSNENLKFFANTEIKTRAEPSEALAPACVYAEQALSDYDLRSKLFLDFAEKTEASVVLEKALANSHSLFQLCKDLNQESSFESVEELFEELYIEEEGAFYVLNQLFVVVLAFFLLFNLNFLSIYWLVFLCFLIYVLLIFKFFGFA